MPLELLPRAQGPRVRHAIDEQLAVEVVDLVLERARGEPLHLAIDLVPVAVPRADAHVHDALHLAAEVRDREAPLVVHERVVGEELDLRVHEDGEGDVGLVRVARVVLHPDGADLDGLVHLVGGDAGAVGVDHRLDEVVDEALRLRLASSSRVTARAFSRRTGCPIVAIFRIAMVRETYLTTPSSAP